MTEEAAVPKERIFKFDKNKVKLVPLKSVSPNDYNPKEKNAPEFETIKQGLGLKGQRLPIVVRTKKGKYVIIDGEQRWRALRELGYRDIIIYDEGNVSDREARELTLWYQQRVPFDELALAELLKGFSSSDIDLEIPYNRDEIKNIVGVLDFDWSKIETASSATEKSRDGEGGKTEAGEEATSITVSVSCTPEEQAAIMTTISFVVIKNGCSSGAALRIICDEYRRRYMKK